MKLFLIRHAIPNIENYNNIFPGPGLGLKGKIQAEWIANYLSAMSIYKIYHSDFTRVAQTMEPFLKIANGNVQIRSINALREREPSYETHESLANRVKTWLDETAVEFPGTTSAIFSHCGPINMVLNYFDPEKKAFYYPYISKHGCNTPLAGIWELTSEEGKVNANLVECPVTI